MAKVTKLVALAGAATVGLALVIACGDDADSDPPNEPTPDASTRDAAPQGLDDASVDATPIPDAGPPMPYFDINHVLGTGQSLSVGAIGSPPLSTAQPYDNVTFDTGVVSGGDAGAMTRFVPLVEASIVGGNAVETMTSAFANLVTKLARETDRVAAPEGERTHDFLASVHGKGGEPYANIKRGTPTYAAGMTQVARGMELAKAAGKSYVVRAFTNVHGESDHIGLNAGYEANLVEWQANYEADVRAITGQTLPVPMFHTQMSSWTKYGAPISVIPLAQLAAHVNHPGTIILVGPKYHLPYTDGVHLTNAGYRHMGEDYAKAYRRVIVQGSPWEPLRPKSITRSGATITVTFHVPSPPLVLDTTHVTNPGSFGFEYVENGAAPAITAVAVSGADAVTITLAATPAGNGGRVRYAATGVANANAGPTTGARGNLRDSDATPSLAGNDLWNWCVHFDQAVQ